MDHEKEMSESKETAALQDKVNYCDCIIATLREPFVVLDHDLRIKTANRSFYADLARARGVGNKWQRKADR